MKKLVANNSEHESKENIALLSEGINLKSINKIYNVPDFGHTF